MKYKGKLWMTAAALGLCALSGRVFRRAQSPGSRVENRSGHAGVDQEDTTSLSVEAGTRKTDRRGV